MNSIANENSKDIFEWFNWLNNTWSNYEAFIQFEDGLKPKDVAENFLDLNKVEFLKFFEKDYITIKFIQDQRFFIRFGGFVSFPISS